MAGGEGLPAGAKITGGGDSHDERCPLPPSSAGEALGMLRSALGYLAAADATAMAAEEQARCLRALEQATSVGTAARASILGAFTAGQGYAADADYSPRAWRIMIHQTRISKGAAVAHTAWARRAAAHPQVAQVLATGEMSESFARAICTWTDKLSADCREAADAILLAAARAGGDLRDLAGLAAEILSRSLPQDKNQDQAFEDRSVRLETTFDGAGVLAGDLTPECAAVVTAVLDALSAPPGRKTPSSQAQRYHDALHEACQRLVTAGLLPQRAGQPVKVWAHISLADLMVLEGSSALLEEWASHLRARWAGYRAQASTGGGDGGAWLDGDAAQAVACDAAMAPFVTGEVNPAALEDLLRLCVQLDRLRHHATTTTDDGVVGDAGHPSTVNASPDSTDVGGTASPDGQGVPGAGAALGLEALERAIIGRAVDLLSGPGGLASFLRRRQLGARLAGPSLPLDIGYAETIPAAIRNAVILRDQRCRWAGRCNQPASACEVHHVTHKADGGKTSTRDCVLLC